MPTFTNNVDRCFYLTCLHEGAREEGCDIHGYVLMTNHVHLLVTPMVKGAVSRLMQGVGRRYVGNVNKIHGRTGTLWEGRFKSAAIDSYGYALACMRYIDLNPIRSGMVEDAGDYRWSSYRHHAGEVVDPLVTDHPVYLALGDSSVERGRHYMMLCAMSLDAGAIAGIRASIARPRGRPPEKGSESFPRN